MKNLMGNTDIKKGHNCISCNKIPKRSDIMLCLDCYRNVCDRCLSYNPQRLQLCVLCSRVRMIKASRIIK